MGFFDDFMGKTQRKDAQRGGALAAQNYNTGLNQYTGTAQDYLGQSLEQTQPYQQAGADTLSLYQDYLGTSGPEAQQGFFDNLQFGPQYEAANANAVRNLDRSAAARGSLYSGGQLENLYNQGLQSFGQTLNPYVDRLERGAQQGYGAAQNAAGQIQQTGQGIADAQFGTSQLLANNDINTQNAVAQSRNVGFNNILGIANVAASAFGGGVPGLGGQQQQQTPNWNTQTFYPPRNS